jgi:cytidyltransferase-like protein
MITIQNIVQNIHNSHKKIVMAITGGGVSSLYYMMSQPGASNTVLELIVPYDKTSLLDFLKKTVLDQYCSQETADEMALASLNRAKELVVMANSKITDIIDNCIGIGATAALRSSEWKKGKHRCYVTILTSQCKHSFIIELNKGTEESPYRSRSEEDEVCGNLIVNGLALALKLIEITDITIDPLDTFTYNYQILDDPIDRLINGSCKSILLLKDRVLIDIPIHKLNNKLIMVPGSFNPLHEGHIMLLEKGKELGNTNEGLFELCISNVDKPTLSKDEIIRRVAQIRYPIILTNSPKFIQKATLFPGLSFSVGIDTVIRLIDPYYSNNNEQEMLINILKIKENGTQFFVGSRFIKSNIISLDLLNISPLFRDMFIQIEDETNILISSTSIREATM